MERTAMGASACVALIAGVALLAFSPTGCSCIRPADELSAEAGSSAPGTLLSASAVEAGLNHALRGRPVTARTYPLAGGNCRRRTQLVVCRVPVQTSALLEHGFNVTYHTADGRIRSVAVARGAWLRD